MPSYQRHNVYPSSRRFFGGSSSPAGVAVLRLHLRLLLDATLAAYPRGGTDASPV
jgi:hypothetical protein